MASSPYSLSNVGSFSGLYPFLNTHCISGTTLDRHEDFMTTSSSLYFHKPLHYLEPNLCSRQCL
jgi:hypothetical protein